MSLVFKVNSETYVLLTPIFGGVRGRESKRGNAVGKHLIYSDLESFKGITCSHILKLVFTECRVWHSHIIYRPFTTTDRKQGGRDSC